jgi:LysM repeat protein
MHRTLVTCLALVLAAGTARAGIDNAGTTAGNFLSVGTGASVLAMGGASLATGDDLHAAAWNPAALARLGTTQFALSHATLAQLSAQDLAAAGGRVGHGATRWGANVLYQSDGSFDGRDALGGPTGTFNVSSMAVGIQVARPLGDRVTAGMGARWLGDNLGDAKGTGLSLDFGLQARAGGFGIGAAARNVGGSMSYPSGRFDLPAVYGVGTSWNDESHGLRLAVDANFPSAYYNDVRFGGEWRWQDRVALRAGYRMELGATSGEPLGGPSFGLGAGANGIWMDYAFLAGNADAQGQHRIGLTFRPGFHGVVARPVAGTHGAETSVNEARSASSLVTLELMTDARPDATLLATDASAEAPAPGQAPSAEAVLAEALLAEAAPASGQAGTSAQASLDLSDRLPPGATESESSPRDLVPLYALLPSLPVPVSPLVITKPTGYIGDQFAGDASMIEVEEVAPRAVAPKAAAPKVAAPKAVAPVVAARPSKRAASAPPAAAPPAAAPPAPAPRPVATRPAAATPAPAPAIVAPAVVTPPVAPRPAVTRPAVARPVVAPPAPAPLVAAPPAAAPEQPAVLAVNHPVRPARVPKAARAPKPVVAPVTAPDSAPESVAPTSGPDDASATPPAPAAPSAPAAPQGNPEPARPAKTSPWPTVSAVMPSAHLAGSSPKVAVVKVPANAPSTAPITRPSKTTPRPESVNVEGDETLADIARRWDTSVPALMMENNLVNMKLKRGQKLMLPPALHP